MIIPGSTVILPNPLKALELLTQFAKWLDDYLEVIYRATLYSLKIYLKAIEQKPAMDSEGEEVLIRIGELAKMTNESNSTIRYWTKIGLLAISSTTPSGYQLYRLIRDKEIVHG